MGQTTQRDRAACAVLFLLAYAVFFEWNVGHFLGKSVFADGEIQFYVAYADAASAALRRFEVPLTYANDGRFQLQPSFLYYSAVFPMVSGLIGIAFRLEAYDSVLLTVATMAFLGAAGVYLSALQLGLSPWSALFAPVVFLSSPYLITDLFARSALSEFCAFGVLPLWLWLAIRFGQRPSRRRFLLLGLAYGLVILAHKIFALWTFGFGVLLAGLNRDLWLRCAAGHVAAVAFGLAVTLPLWANSALELDHLAIAHLDLSSTLKRVGAARNDLFDGPPSPTRIQFAFLNADLSALFPFPYVHPFASPWQIRLQVGVIVLVALLLFRPAKAPATERLFLALTLLSFVLSASLFHLVPFWRFVPQPLTIIQMPARLLTYTTIFGAILAALVVERHRAERPLVAGGIAVGVCLVHVAIFHYRPEVGPVSSQQITATKLVSADYKVVDGPPAPTSAQPAAVSLHDLWPGNCVKGSVTAAQPGPTELPVAYSGLLRALVDRRAVPLRESSDGHLVVPLDAGPHAMRVCRYEPIPVMPFYLGLVALAGASLIAAVFWRGRRPRGHAEAVPLHD